MRMTPHGLSSLIGHTTRKQTTRPTAYGTVLPVYVRTTGTSLYVRIDFPRPGPARRRNFGNCLVHCTKTRLLLDTVTTALQSTSRTYVRVWNEELWAKNLQCWVQHQPAGHHARGPPFDLRLTKRTKTSFTSQFFFTHTITTLYNGTDVLKWDTHAFAQNNRDDNTHLSRNTTARCNGMWFLSSDMYVGPRRGLLYVPYVRTVPVRYRYSSIGDTNVNL